MDDTKDKVRRNLVAFSAAIIIGWFLELKLADILKPVVPASLDHVSPIKLWLVIFVVLVYLFLRYRFDTSTNSQISFLRDEMETQYQNYVFKYLQRKINQINRSGKFSTIFNRTLPDLVNEQKQHLENQLSERVKFILSISNPWGVEDTTLLDIAHKNWSGTIGITESYFREGQARNHMSSSGQRHNFSIPLSGRTWVRVHVFSHLAFYSKSSIELFVPIILASFALLIIIHNLVAAFSKYY